MKLLSLTNISYKNLVLLALPLLLIILLRVIGFDGLYGQDSYEYLRYTNVIQNYITNGIHPGPFFWPVLYPTLGSLLGFLFGSTVFSLQIISCLSFSTACIYIYKTIKLLYPKSKFQFSYVLIFGTLCPFLLKMSVIIMSDVLALSFISISFYYFFKSYYKKTSLAPIFIFATCALMTRYASLFITFPIIIYSLYLIIKEKKYIQFSIGFLISLIALVPFLIFQWGSLFKASTNSFLTAWSISHFFKSSFTTSDGTTSYKFPNLIYALYIFFHPGFIFIGSLLSFLTLKKRNNLFSFHQKVLLSSSVIYILFLAGIPFQNPRILGLVFPLVLITLFPAFTKLTEFKRFKKHFKLIGIIFIILQLTLFTLTFKLIFARTVTEKELVKMIQPYEGNTLYSFDVDLAMKGRGLDFKFKNMYLTLYKNLQKNDLILFDSERYNSQWKGKNPMLNWEFIKDNYELKIIESHPKGWKLYQIQ